MIPSAIPYEPSDGTDIDTQSPSGVPSTQSRMWSTVALAALAAELAPRASMMAAPRCCTVGRKVDSIQAWSSIASAAFLPSTRALNRSGYWVAEWLPQIVMWVTALTLVLSLAASWALARLWSSRVSALNRSRGMSGALLMAISALVLAGFPVINTLTSSAALSFSARP